MKLIVSTIFSLFALQLFAQPSQYEITRHKIFSRTMVGPRGDVTKTYYSRDGHDSLETRDGKLFTFKRTRLPDDRLAIVKLDQNQKEIEQKVFRYLPDSSYDVEYTFHYDTFSRTTISRYSKDHREKYMVGLKADTAWYYYNRAGNLEKIVKANKGKQETIYKITYDKKERRVKSVETWLSGEIWVFYEENESGLISVLKQAMYNKRLSDEQMFVSKFTYEFYK